MKLTRENITPALMIANEEYWIHYVLRDLLKMFGKAVVLDTGSIDSTKSIVTNTVRAVGGTVTLLAANYGTNPVLIGEGRNVLRRAVGTHWMLLVDGDEIWRTEQLQRMLEFEVPDDTKVVMFGGKQVQEVDGQLLLRTNDVASVDRLFAPGVQWTKKDYPFEGYGLHDKMLPGGVVKYLPANEVFEYHMRHTKRSSVDSMTYFRDRKRGYFQYGDKEGETFEPLPKGWLGELCVNCPDPYNLKG
jgi:hypothetical protein